MGGSSRHVRHQRADELLKGEHRRYRISGNSDQGLHLAGAGFAHAENRRLPRKDRDAVDEELADLFHDGRGEILAPGGRARVHEHDVGALESVPGGLLDGLEAILDDGIHKRRTAPFGDVPRNDNRVEFDQIARLEVRPRRDQFIPRGDNGHDGSRSDRHLGDAGGEDAAEIVGAETVARRKQ